MSYVEQYYATRRYFEFCIAGQRDATTTGGDIMWFAALGDNYVEMGILEELMLEDMEGLS